eukprot:m.183909 g.183909  ORF g.183909 m.183909 type:complete len:655 (+) comp14704_c0_seq6:307-2271(+)
MTSPTRFQQSFQLPRAEYAESPAAVIEGQSTRLRKRTDGVELLYAKRLPAKITSICFSSAGQGYVTGSADGVVREWATDEARIVREYRHHKGAVWSVAYSPSSSKIASGAWDCSVCLYDRQTGNLLFTLQGHKGPVSAVQFSESDLLLSGSMDGTVRIWNVRSGELVDILHCGSVHGVACVAISPRETLIAEGSYDHTVQFWELTPDCRIRQRIERNLELQARELEQQFQSRDAQKRLRHAKQRGREDKADFFNLQLGSGTTDQPEERTESPLGEQQPRSERVRHKGIVSDLAFTHDGRILASASHDGTVVLTATATFQRMRQLHMLNNTPAWSCNFSTDNSILAVGCGNGAVSFFDDDGTLLLSFAAHKKYVGALAFSSDSLLLASGSEDMCFRLWELLPSHELLQLLKERITQRLRAKERDAAKKEEKRRLERLRREEQRQQKRTEKQADDFLRRMQKQKSRQQKKKKSLSRKDSDYSFTDSEASMFMSAPPRAPETQTDDMSRARIDAIHRLLDHKRELLRTEQMRAGVLEEDEKALAHELSERQHRAIRRLELDEKEKDLGIPAPLRVSADPQQALKMNQIHHRLKELYTRVGRTYRGDTWTYHQLPPLTALDTPRQAQFQEALLRTLRYEAFDPYTLDAMATHVLEDAL